MKTICFLILFFCLFACQQEKPSAKTEQQVEYQNDAHRLVAETVSKTGNYEQLKAMVDVTGTFTLLNSRGFKLVRNFQFIFDGEQAASQYEIERDSVTIKREEGFDGENVWQYENGVVVTDESKLKQVRNAQKTAFYLFAMNQKLLDPGLQYEFVRKDTVDAQFYDVVKVSFQDSIGDYQDTYYLYINQNTKLIDQYLLTVLAYEITEPELVRCTYERFGEVMIPTHIRYTESTWEGDILEDKWNEEIFEHLKFNQGVVIEKPRL